MAEDFPASSVATTFLHSEAAGALDTSEPTAPPAPAEVQPESRTRGMLRDAIQKVMAEIAYHETEAKKHRQQAEELRKDLRESFAFLQVRGDKGKSAELVLDPDKLPEPPKNKAKETPADDKPPRAVKKKSAGKK